MRVLLGMGIALALLSGHLVEMAGGPRHWRWFVSAVIWLWLLVAKRRHR